MAAALGLGRLGDGQPGRALDVIARAQARDIDELSRRSTLSDQLAVIAAGWPNTGIGRYRAFPATSAVR